MHTALLQRDQSNRTIFIVAAYTHKQDIWNAATEWVTSKKNRATRQTWEDPLQHTASHCNTQQQIETHYWNTTNWNTFEYTWATQFSVRRLTATHYNTLQHNAAPCNTLQHTTIYCNTLATHLLWQGIHRLSVQMQHIATHCNYLSKQCRKEKGWREPTL